VTAELLREVVLVGGGHAHVQVLRMQAMDPLPGARLTVVVDRSEAVYSGMVPGFVAGQYSAAELTIDVRPLARRAGARFVEAACTGIDAKAKRLHLAGRPALSYDLASLNVGSTVAHTDLPGVRAHALPTRPIGRFVGRVEAALASARGAGGLDVVVVGGGAGGIELAFALEARLRAEGQSPRLTLVTASDRLLADRPARLSARLARLAADRGISVVLGRRVCAVTATDVALDDGQHLPSQLTVWVTGATAPPWLAASSLPGDPNGFVRVADTLEVTGEDGLFAVGDCAVLESWPAIPKAGVYAVRQGPVLRDNLARALRGEPLRSYVPQRDFLTLLNLGDGRAVGAREPAVLEGTWAMRLKDRIDRRFMARFQVLGPDGAADTAFARDLPAMDNVEMVCGGCAAKVAETPLRRALARLPEQVDDTVSVGLRASDDVAAVTHGDQLLVANLDAFTAFVDDPWLVGRVGAHNALSDLHASGVRPRYAMALVTIPDDAEPEETLFQVMSGVRKSLDEDGVTLVGGHTTVGPDLVVGLSVWGSASALWPKGGLRVGDLLVLSRPLGTGVLFHADMAGRATGAWMREAVANMLRGNGPASRALAGLEDSVISGVTDVTGFGLAGHLGEMLRASGCSAQLFVSDLPLLPGVATLLGRGERSTFHDQNRSVRSAVFVHREVAEDPALEVLFDPQTAGGLLLGVDPAAADTVITALTEAGDTRAAIVGRVTEPREDEALFSIGSH